MVYFCSRYVLMNSKLGILSNQQCIHVTVTLATHIFALASGGIRVCSTNYGQLRYVVLAPGVRSHNRRRRPRVPMTQGAHDLAE